MRKGRGLITAELVRMLAEHPGTEWRVPEIVIKTTLNRRTVERVLADLIKARVVEKHYQSYRLGLDFMQSIYGKQWYVRQEIEKKL